MLLSCGESGVLTFECGRFDVRSERSHRFRAESGDCSSLGLRWLVLDVTQLL